MKADDEEEKMEDQRLLRSQGSGDGDLVYDPNQNVEVKRQLRREYRQLVGDGVSSNCWRPCLFSEVRLSRLVTQCGLDGAGTIDANSQDSYSALRKWCAPLVRVRDSCHSLLSSLQ